MRRRIILIGALLLAALSLPPAGRAQSYRSLVHEGNDFYRQGRFDDAKLAYEKSVRKDSGRLEGHFNLGNALYRAGDQKGAIAQYMKAIPRVRSGEQAEQSLYNIGNSFLSAGELAEKSGAQQPGQGSELAMDAYRQAVTAYKKALKVDATDENARYNLAYAQRKLRQMENNQQNKNQDQKKQDQQNQKDQQKQDQQKNDQQKNEDKKQQQQQQNQNDQKGKEQEARKKPQQPEQDKNRMSKQEAERILDALKNDEKNLQKKLRVKAHTRYQVDKDW